MTTYTNRNGKHIWKKTEIWLAS